MEDIKLSGSFADAIAEAEKEIQQEKAEGATGNAEEPVEAGEPIVEEVALQPAVELRERTKLAKYTLRLNMRKGGVFTPPGVIFIGGGDPKAKYLQWLERRFKKFFETNGSSTSLGIVDIKAPQSERLFVQWLTLVAVLLDEVEIIDWQYPRHPKINVHGLVTDFVKENHAGLRDLAPYFGILKDKINPQPIAGIDDQPTADPVPEVIPEEADTEKAA